MEAMLVPATTRRRTLRRLLHTFIEERLEGENEVRTNELVAHAYHKFRNDPEFIDAAVRDAIQQMIPQMLGETLRRRRSRWVTTAVGAISRQRLEDTARERLEQVFENANGRYLEFTEMTRPDLLAAAEGREKRAAGELKWANFERAVAKLLPNDEIKVGDQLDSKTLGGLLARYFAN